MITVDYLGSEHKLRTLLWCLKSGPMLAQSLKTKWLHRVPEQLPELTRIWLGAAGQVPSSRLLRTLL